MSQTCTKCEKPAATYIRYNGTHLCDEHFKYYFMKRVKRDIKKQGKTKGKSTIAVAVSGGKDSTAALHLIHQIFSQRRNVEVYAITVDEGIEGYRPESITCARENCEQLGVPHHVVSFEEMMGVTMDDISPKVRDLGECAFCGVFRRWCLNKKAKELDADRLVVGHNLDDVSQSILMNFVNSDLEKLARLGPHKRVQPGLIPRMVPLRSIPEKEVTLYALLTNIRFHAAQCPYSTTALRGQFRDIIDELEYHHPGTRHSILNSYDGIKDLLLEKYPQQQLNKCVQCGEPTPNNICKACQLAAQIKNKDHC